MREHTVPGAAIAIADRGKLVYARGFGFADKESQTLVQPNSLFRIASLSKPITAVAILLLVENEQLKLDDHVHTILELGPAADERWHAITIKHLLNHTAGWDRNKSFDPMFVPNQVTKQLHTSLPLRHQDIIEFMLTKQFDSHPGSHYAYSNFGYCLLGRVIEKISGESYESFVRERVLKPLHVLQPKIGSSLAEQREPNEVTYYDEKTRTTSAVVGKIGEQVSYPYGAFDMRLMDSHGGWIAGAVDMVKFASDLPVRGANRESIIVKPSSLEWMDTPYESSIDLDENGAVKKVRYGLGWSLRELNDHRYNAWHTGELNGTSAIMVRRTDDKCWAVLFNARANSKGEYLPSMIDPLIHRAVDSVKTWPAGDLFSKWLT